MADPRGLTIVSKGSNYWLSGNYTVEYRRIVGRLISKVTLFKPSNFVSSYGTELMFSFVVWFNMCGDRSHFLFTKFSFTETS